MAERYQYEGPGPHEDPELGLVRPGDVLELGAEPGWGPWRCLTPPEPEDAAPEGVPPVPAGPLSLPAGPSLLPPAPPEGK